MADDGGLSRQIRILAELPPRGPALIYRTPQDQFWVSETGYTGSPANAYVISRDQLDDLMHENSIGVGDLEDEDVLARLTSLVVAWGRVR
jgi:hypothetical protein